jgi:hypothetical protein
MILDFVLLCLKFLAFIFLVNMAIALILTLTEMFLILKKKQLHKSNIYGTMLLILFPITLVLNVLLYTDLLISFSPVNATEELSRTRLLFVLIPLLIGRSLMSHISNTSKRNFQPDVSTGKITNFIPTYINFGLIVLMILQSISLINPSAIRYLIIVYNYILV